MLWEMIRFLLSFKTIFCSFARTSLSISVSFSFSFSHNHFIYAHLYMKSHYEIIRVNIYNYYAFVSCTVLSVLRSLHSFLFFRVRVYIKLVLSFYSIYMWCSYKQWNKKSKGRESRESREKKIRCSEMRLESNGLHFSIYLCVWYARASTIHDYILINIITIIIINITT